MNKSINGITSIILGLILCQSSHAVTFGYSGTLEHVFVDSGTGSYTGSMIGDTFFGVYSTEDSVSNVTSVLPCLVDECEYTFSGPSIISGISDGTTTKSGTDAAVFIWDNYDLEVGDASVVNLLPGISWSVGTLLDGWIGDVLLTDGSLMEVGFVSLDTGLYSNRDYRAQPPDLSMADLAYFSIEEYDSFGNTTFSGFGRLNAVQVVPVPAAVWLFGSGLLGLIGVIRRKKFGS